MGICPTEGVTLSGDDNIRNCKRIALRRTSDKPSAEGAIYTTVYKSLRQKDRVFTEDITAGSPCDHG